MKITTILICLISFNSQMCRSQTNAAAHSNNASAFGIQVWCGDQVKIPVDATNWGSSVQNVRLQIYLTNSVVHSGSSLTMLGIITNASTNAIALTRTVPTTGYDVRLTSRAGKSYDLTEMPALMNARGYYAINQGVISAVTLPVNFGTNIEPGDYTLQATRAFSSSDGNFKLESNPLKIQIK